MTAVAGTRLIESRVDAEKAITAYRERHLIDPVAQDPDAPSDAPRMMVCKHDGIRVYRVGHPLRSNRLQHDMDEVRDLDRLAR